MGTLLRPRPWPVAVAVAMAGCLAPRAPRPDTGRDPTEVVPAPPDIVRSSIACRPREGLWRLQLQTAGWVEGVQTWWTVDGAYVETHRLASHAYDPDGTGELLFLDLPVAPDLRWVEEDVATAFSCGDAPSILWAIIPPDGPVHACIDTEGSFDDWSDVPGVPTCPGNKR
jgi:hypothetical protein